jgi:ferredoxin
MKVIVDRNLCQGIGNCVVMTPGVFQLYKENKAVAAHLEDISQEKIREAAESCPLDVIIF